MSDLSDLELLEAFGVEVETEKQAARSPREERILAGFEEIQRFVEQHGRTPQHGEHRDIFERLYAVRLVPLRELEECRTLLAPIDHQGLLAARSVRPWQSPTRWTTKRFLPSWALRPACRKSPNFGTSVRQPRSRQPRKSRREVRGFRVLQAALRPGAAGA